MVEENKFGKQIEKSKAQKDAELRQRVLERLKDNKLKKEKKDGVISFEELENKQKNKPKIMEAAKGGLAEATAKLKAKGFSEGGAVVKDKIVSIDKSPNSGLITVKGFGAGRRT